MSGPRIGIRIKGIPQTQAGFELPLLPRILVCKVGQS